MSARSQALANLFKSRLSRRIVLWVFVSIVVIEAIILVPSVYRRQQELLKHVKEVSNAKAAGIVGRENLSIPAQALLKQLQVIQANEVVLGAALYQSNGELVGVFGNSPQLSFEAVAKNQQAAFVDRGLNYYDAVWSMSPLEGKYVLIIRHDASSVKTEIYHFISRIAGLVLIISLFVTIAMVIVLERTLISPILTLRQDLLRAGEAISRDEQGKIRPQFNSLTTHRQDELGEVIAAFGQMFGQISEAIAERKQAETELRFSEEKFSKAFHSSPNPITISTLVDGNLIEANDSFLHLYGASLEKVLGHTSLELNLWVEPEDRAKMIQTLRRMGVIRNQEYRFQTHAGDMKTVLYSSERININNQECILSVINDITQRKQAEEALRESEERFRALVEQAVDAFFVADPEGRLIDVNQRACDVLGYSRPELLSLSVPDIQQKLPTKNFTDLWQQLASGPPMTIEGVHRRRDGSTFPVEVRVGAFAFGGRQLVLALARDITERKQAEKAVARLAEIGELAAMIIHEVRNPLTTVLMGLNSFKRMNLPERATMRLNLALEESERLQRLLNEILLYARRQALRLIEMEVNGFIHEILASIQAMPAAAERQIKFMPLRTPVQVLADRDKLRQVFINLISNACEAVCAKEIITWQLSQPTANGQIEIRIHNGGDPIPADVLPNLTKPFFTTKPSGNGLGLAITKRIVEAHGGELMIESSAEAGTTVTVSLPLSTQNLV
ncbi:MAG: PAS domain S-box protein [Cyanothece sp. SIO1E1]|nr:PAS domain S-box protein [Cyanothece sp. SIO1E1]